MSNTFKHLTQPELDEGKKLLAVYTKLPEVERMQARIYINALFDRSEIARDLARVGGEEAIKAG